MAKCESGQGAGVGAETPQKPPMKARKARQRVALTIKRRPRGEVLASGAPDMTWDKDSLSEVWKALRYARCEPKYMTPAMRSALAKYERQALHMMYAFDANVAVKVKRVEKALAKREAQDGAK